MSPADRFVGCALSIALCTGVVGAHAVPRTIDGSGNNLANPHWGATHSNLLRLSPAAYDDGISTPRGGLTASTLPSARAVSNAIHRQSADTPNGRNLSGFLWQWGQFVDHDIDLTEAADPAEPFDIAVPTGDAQFDPMFTGTRQIALNRSQYDGATGTSAANPREQHNSITAWIDASVVYGSDTTTAASLRSGSDGLLASSVTAVGHLMPTGPGGMFAGGDVRAMEQVGLTAMHTLFMREHNRIATELKNAGFSTVDETLYQAARKVVGAEMQQITYNEFLPALLGESVFNARIGTWSAYDATIDAGIANEFSTAAYRIGHTMLPTELWQTDASLNVTGALPLRDAFFDPSHLAASGIDPFLGGLARQHAQEIDAMLVDDVRNFLFGPPGAGGFDLAALNIQRGRDHGLGSYNSVRSALGLAPALTFGDITADTGLQAALSSLYGSVDEVDLWTGGLLEAHLPGGSVGETFAVIIADQFTRLRDGDRFWFENDPDLPALDSFGFGLDFLHSLRLGDVLRANTNLAISAAANVFFVQPVPAPTVALLALLAAGGVLVRRRRYRTA